MLNYFSRLRQFKAHIALLSLVLSTGLIVLLCLLFDSRWETNDDVGMSMVAHGYGIAAYGSPYLIFSNVLWGYIVRTIPPINGVLGYSLATMMVLAITAWAIFYFLLRLKVTPLAGFCVIALLFTRPTLFPQFTVNAGLLAVAAVIAWRVHARDGDLGSLIIACGLAFVGFLIRSQEFLLVLIVASPLLPWCLLKESERVRLTAFFMVSAIVLAIIFDHLAYSGTQWDKFRALNMVRAAYTDFGAAAHLKTRPEILSKFGYSINDLNLISEWFFSDPSLAAPKPLNEMLVSLGPLPVLTGNINLALEAVKTLWKLTLLPLTLIAMASLILFPNRRTVMAWCVCIAMLILMGILGRPGVTRVYVPIMCLLIVAPFIYGQRSRRREAIAVLVVLLALIASFKQLIPESRMSTQLASKAQAQVRPLASDQSYVSWGASFPFELTFPVMARDSELRKIKLYSLGVFTLAPFSVAYKEEADGEGFIKRFRSNVGVPILLWEGYLPILSNYCKEHYDHKFQIIDSNKTQFFNQMTVTCISNETALNSYPSKKQ